MKIAVIYSFYKVNDNVHYFIHHSKRRTNMKDTEYIFVSSDIENYKLHDYINSSVDKLIFRENEKLDFGSYALVINKYLDIKNYDYFIFLNDTIRGPILNNVDWIYQMTSLINDEVKLVGQTINVKDLISWNPFKNSHVQSYCFCLDNVSLQLLINNHFFDYIPEDKADIINEKEIGMSRLIIKNNYNIASVLNIYKGYDFRKLEDKKYYGDLIGYNENDNIEGFYSELNFYKTNRNETKLFYMKYLMEDNYSENLIENQNDLKMFDILYEKYSTDLWLGHIEFCYFLMKKFAVKSVIDFCSPLSIKIFTLFDVQIYTTSKNIMLEELKNPNNNLKNVNELVCYNELFNNGITLINLFCSNNDDKINKAITYYVEKFNKTNFIILIHNIMDKKVFDNLINLKYFKTFFFHSAGLFVFSFNQNIIDIINNEWKTKLIIHKNQKQLYHYDYKLTIKM